MVSKVTPVSCEAELDAIELPVRNAFSAFMEEVGLRHTSSTVLALTFRTGGLHFAAKALQFIPKDIHLVVAGTNLTSREMDHLQSTGRPVFNDSHRYDNELVYEMLMTETTGSFGWVDADCFVLDPAVWDSLLAPMAENVACHTSFTYDPLGFAKSVLPLFGTRARTVLLEEMTTLNSYSIEPTNVGRAAPHSISRILRENHHQYLRQILGVESNGNLKPHDGLLDIFENGRTVNTRKREQSQKWFGSSVQRTGWLVDTPMMAEIVLRARGYSTKRIIESNKEISQAIIHVGASSYRERMQKEGAKTDYLARFYLTDLFEILLADEIVEKGVGEYYEELSLRQRRRLYNEAGLSDEALKPAARSMLEEQGVDVEPLKGDSRFGFLF